MKNTKKHKTDNNKPHNYIKKQTHKKLHFRKVNCSPGMSNKYRKYTCYDDKFILKMKRLWNNKHPDNKIIGKNIKDIWSELKNKMSNVCETEQCWLNQHFIKNNVSSDLKTYIFAPKMPNSWKTNYNEWLTSTDIIKVMRHVEHGNKHFSFIGPSPIDFDDIKDKRCIWPELCNFNLERHINKGKRKIGIIFNLDPHYKSGSHWVSLFIDCDNEYIFFFDSNGTRIPKEIEQLVKRIQEQSSKIGNMFKFDQNHPFEHQYENTECGIYSIYLIITLLNGGKYDIFKKNRISDKEMEKFRKNIFNV